MKQKPTAFQSLSVFWWRNYHPILTTLFTFLFTSLFFIVLQFFIPTLFSARFKVGALFVLSLSPLFIFWLSYTWLAKILQPLVPLSWSAPYQILPQYNQAIREISNQESLLSYINQTLYQKLKPESVSIWLHQAEDDALILANAMGLPVQDKVVTLALDGILKDLHYVTYVRKLPTSALRHHLLTLGIEAIAPLMLGETFVGLIGLGKTRKGHIPDAGTVYLLGLMAEESALAVKNSHLMAEQKEILSQLKLAYRRTIEAQNEERRRLASELHDDILGRLTSITRGLYQSQQLMTSKPTQVENWLENLEEESRYVQHRLREITQGLHPSVLTDLGLISALRAYLDALTKKPLPATAPESVVITINGFGYGRLVNPQLEQDVYSIARQALDNAINHAAAKQIFIHLHWCKDTLRLTVKDTGCGLKDKVEHLMGQNGHLGLLSMHERTRAWDGRFSIDSQPTQGTTIYATLPLDQLSPAPNDLQTFTYYLQPPRQPLQPARPDYQKSLALSI